MIKSYDNYKIFLKVSSIVLLGVLTFFLIITLRNSYWTKIDVRDHNLKHDTLIIEEYTNRMFKSVESVLDRVSKIYVNRGMSDNEGYYTIFEEMK